ncbi:MAG TPA: Lpg1974 family pore-forming outer membrane protein [Rhabdochlamydiaceae bacterium]|nr:Lpg1974 family pore-forming outer membrane protein [Rhabdochlamydiaceae bacterium]
MILDPKRTWLLITTSAAMTIANVHADNPNSGMNYTASKNGQNSPFDPTNYSGWRPVERHDFMVSGEFLYWRAAEGGTDYAVTSKNDAFTNPLALPIDGAVKKVDFEFTPGFRVAVGYTVPKRIWDLSLAWTRLHTSHSHHTEVPEGPGVRGRGGFIFPTREYEFSQTNETPETASGHWDIDFDSLTLEMGRAFGVNRYFAFRPHVGFIGAWIDQDITFKYNDLHNQSGVISSDLSVKWENDFTGWGLRGGIDNRFLFGRGWSVYGNIAAAILWGDFDLHAKSQKFYPPSAGRAADFASLKDGFRDIVGQLQLALGLRYDVYCYKNRIHFGFHAGWEFQEWFEQNQLRAWSTQQFNGTLTRDPGDLGFQGFVGGLRFDF